MKGITSEYQNSLGSTTLTLIFRHLSIEHKIHIVPDIFQIPAHGIIGKDFIKRNKCLLDFDQMTFTVRPKNEHSVKIDIQSEIIRGLSAVPARSETFKMFRIKSTQFPCVEKYPRPKDKESCKSFTAFTNYYRRFIENYAEITKPLHKLTSKKNPFIWTEECENAFNQLKQKLMSPPILKYPIPGKEYTITVDSSSYAFQSAISHVVLKRES